MSWGSAAFISSWSTGCCKFNKFCRFAHPPVIETRVDWICVHPTEYLIAMIQECSRFPGCRILPIISFLRQHDFLERIQFDLLVGAIDFPNVGDFRGELTDS